MAEGGGQWGRMAGRGAGGRGGAVRIGPMGRDRWGGWEGEQSEGSEGAEGALWPPVLPYRAEEGERDRVEEGASGFGLPILAVPTAGQPIGRATGQRGAFAAYPPHPSPPPPSAGGHTLFLKGAPLKNFSGFSKWENALSAEVQQVYHAQCLRVPPSCSSRLPPSPPLQGTLPPLKYFYWSMVRGQPTSNACWFRAWRGRN